MVTEKLKRYDDFSLLEHQALAQTPKLDFTLRRSDARLCALDEITEDGQNEREEYLNPGWSARCVS
jgi:hypothetical protein